MACTCQSCNKIFKVDVIVSNVLWEKIKPAGKPEGAGLLCGACVINRIEAVGEYGAFLLIEQN